MEIDFSNIKLSHRIFINYCTEVGYGTRNRGWSSKGVEFTKKGNAQKIVSTFIHHNLLCSNTGFEYRLYTCYGSLFNRFNLYQGNF